MVIGPGCLMYGVIISYEGKPELRSVDNAHTFVMERFRGGLSSLEPVEFQGSCDLTLDNRKFSGNALRCKRNCFLYHGTILYDFPLQTLSKYLGTPPRQPEYRKGRDHSNFVRNFPASGMALRETISNAWNVSDVRKPWPKDAVAQLVQGKYSLSSWNRRL